MNSPADDRAFVTVLSTDNYLDGVLALHASLLRTRTAYKLVVAVGQLVGSSSRDQLKRAGLEVLELSNRIDLPDELLRDNRDTGHQHWNATFDKLAVFSLPRFRKIVLLDSDMIVLKNIDALFDKPHLSAVAAGAGWPGNESWNTLNSGLMVIEPHPDEAARLAQFIPAAARRMRRGVSDQDVLHEAFPDWASQAQLQLGETYNLFVPYLDFYMRHLGYRWSGTRAVRVLHFIGVTKPWMMSGRKRVKHCLRLLKRGNWHQCVAIILHARMLRKSHARMKKAPVPT